MSFLTEKVNMNEYKIGGKEFQLKSLVLGQWQQLLELEIDETLLQQKVTGNDLLKSDIIYKFFAIILTEKGQHLQSKNINELEQFIKWNIEPDQVGGIVTDFFALKAIEKITTETYQSILNVAAIVKAFQ